MTNPWRPLALAAVVSLTVGVGAAAAQTAIATNAPAGSTVELVLNGATVGTATADPTGYATIPINLAANTGGKTETDVYIFVDVCASSRRIVIAERGQPTSSPGDCERRDMGLFLLRRASTLSVNMGGVNPTVLLVQGRFDPREPRPVRSWNAAPTGLVLGVGGIMRSFRDARTLACGQTSDCDGGGFNTGGIAGATYWIKPYLAADVSVMIPVEATIEGSGDGFEFTTIQDVRVLQLGGILGVPAGPARVYGKGGGIFNQSTFETTHTTDATTVTIDGTVTTVPGGTQKFELKTEGWSWYVGGGLEVWIKGWLAIYGEATFNHLKGDPVDDADGLMDDRLNSFVVGMKFHIGG